MDTPPRHSEGRLVGGRRRKVRLGRKSDTAIPGSTESVPQSGGEKNKNALRSKIEKEMQNSHNDGHKDEKDLNFAEQQVRQRAGAKEAHELQRADMYRQFHANKTRGNHMNERAAFVTFNQRHFRHGADK
ncbi:unnamed protein product [Amoebophrya sp. A25]|nr:unnamed protein product [Amoebophrya sp. A25]|eukprot:GSA25T00004060001.1